MAVFARESVVVNDHVGRTNRDAADRQERDVGGANAKRARGYPMPEFVQQYAAEQRQDEAGRPPSL